MATPKKTVGVDEFRKFQAETRDGMSAILEALEGMKHPMMSAPAASIGADQVIPGKVVQTSKAETGAFDDNELPPQYYKIFAKWFDSEDGFSAKLSFPEVDEKGNESGGITFTIVVPSKLSNASDTQRKGKNWVDLRTRALKPEGIAKGIDEWCKAVAKNLKYNRLAKIK